MPHLVCSLTFVQYTMEVIENALISRMPQIVLFSWKKDQLINVVDCRRLMVEILIDPNCHQALQVQLFVDFHADVYSVRAARSRLTV
jgi:hypothetical protein